MRSFVHSVVFFFIGKRWHVGGRGCAWLRMTLACAWLPYSNFRSFLVVLEKLYLEVDGTSDKGNEEEMKEE